MTTYTIYTLPKSSLTVSGGQELSGFSQGNGSHLVGETITINHTSWIPVDVKDSNDTNFNDSDSSQTLASSTLYDGVSYSAGRRVESEYRLTVEDPDGNSYTLLAFNINEPGVKSYSTIEGIAFVGGVDGVPPAGVPLSVVSNREGPSDSFASLAAPPCFVRGSRLKTPGGWLQVEDLAIGDLVDTIDNGPRPILWVGSRTVSTAELSADPKVAPVRIDRGALGNGFPNRPLFLSRHHRVLVRSKIAERMFGSTDALVPAFRLLGLPGVDTALATAPLVYFHILFDRHQLVQADGAVVESLLLGRESNKFLPRHVKEHVFGQKPLHPGSRPAPARLIPLPRQQERLVARHLKNGRSLYNPLLYRANEKHVV